MGTPPTGGLSLDDYTGTLPSLLKSTTTSNRRPIFIWVTMYSELTECLSTIMYQNRIGIGPILSALRCPHWKSDHHTLQHVAGLAADGIKRHATLMRCRSNVIQVALSHLRFISVIFGSSTSAIFVWLIKAWLPHLAHETWPSLLQVMACRLFGAKSLPEQLPQYGQLDA